MNREDKKQGKLRLNKVDKIIIVILLVLMLAMAALSIMSRFGYVLINGSLYILGGFAGIVIILGWGGYRIVRIFKSRNTRLVVGTLASVALLVLITIGTTFISMFASFSIPAEFDTIVNGEKKVVILRGFDVNEDRVILRRDARIANDPESPKEEISSDFGYCYYAYPKALGIFYRADAETEGEIYVAQESEAQLMIEWPDENTAHLFIENAGVGEGGDWYVYF